MADIRPYIFQVVRSMFLATADNSYISARASFFCGADIDFYWLGMSSIEKYLKAILLINGKSVKRHGHEISKILEDVGRLHDSFELGEFVNQICIDALWKDESIESFVRRLEEQGSASGRYMTYGYNLDMSDLFKLDQLVWKIRRHVNFFWRVFENGDDKVLIDWVVQMRENPHHWRIDNFLPIEAVVDGRRGPEVTKLFAMLNAPFFPEKEHELLSWRAASENPPLADYVEFVRSGDVSDGVRDMARDVIRWAIENIKFNKHDENYMRDFVR